MTVGELQQILQEIDPSTEVVVYSQKMEGMRGWLIRATQANLFDLQYLGDSTYTYIKPPGEPERALIIQ
jgi:curli biogenesis system outer membrane secretion channel CsgG